MAIAATMVASLAAAEGGAGAAGGRHHPEQHEGILGGRCRRFRARFGAIRTGRYGGKSRAVGGGFSLRTAFIAEKAMNAAIGDW